MSHLLSQHFAIHSQITQSFTNNHFTIVYHHVIPLPSLFIFLMNPWSLCYDIPTLHHYPYLSLTNWSNDSKLLFHSIFGWLVNCHVSWPLQVYSVDTIVWVALQLCNLRTLLCPSQPSLLLQTSWSSISRAPSIWFTLLHLCLPFASSIAHLGLAPHLQLDPELP